MFNDADILAVFFLAARRGLYDCAPLQLRVLPDMQLGPDPLGSERGGIEASILLRSIMRREATRIWR